MTVSEPGEIVPILQKSLFQRSLALHEELNQADAEVADVMQATEELRHKANAKRKGIRNRLAEVLQELYPGQRITIGGGERG